MVANEHSWLNVLPRFARGLNGAALLRTPLSFRLSKARVADRQFWFL
jgi:hypothetical protein